MDTGLSRNNFCGYAADAGILSNQSQRIRGGYGTLSNQFSWIRGRCGNSLKPVSENTRRVWESLKDPLSSSAVCARVAGLHSLSHRQRRARIFAKVSRRYALDSRAVDDMPCFFFQKKA